MAGTHVGSRAVRRVIETHQPVISLHGHIHESVLVTGKHSSTLGRTRSFNPGHFYDRKTVFAISFLISKPMAAVRLELSRDRGQVTARETSDNRTLISHLFEILYLPSIARTLPNFFGKQP